MTEPNIAQTATLLGKTNVLNLTKDWQTIVFNNLSTQAALKVNSLFVTNRQTSLIDIDIRLGREAPNSPLATYPLGNFYQLVHTLSVPSDATLVAICRDNPVWLQSGDSLQIRAGENYRADAVCSYEYISDTTYTPPPSNAPPAPPQNLRVYTGHFSAPSGQTGAPSSFVLNWLPPATHGTTPLSDYVVQAQVYEAGVSGSEDKFGQYENVIKPESTRTQIQITQIVNTLIGVTTGDATLFSTYPLSPSPTTYFRFRVAAKNSVGTSAFANTAWTRLDTFPPPLIASVAPVALGVTLTWEQYAQSNIGITNYYVRWTRDNGITWEPSVEGVPVSATAITSLQPANIQVGNVDSAAPYLQNGVIYRFAIRAIGERDGAANAVEPTATTAKQTISSPWSLLSPAVTPLPPATVQQLRAMFVSWDQ